MPLEHEVVAFATKFTFVPTVLLFDGLDTVTPANAVAREKKTRMAVEMVARFFILTISLRLGIWSRTGKAIQLRGIHQSGAEHPQFQKLLSHPNGRSGVSGICERRP